jgi:ArsR family transcriptional regulator, lead/cadmium/zinc/bismuth-responsive transcriptional repressor
MNRTQPCRRGVPKSISNLQQRCLLTLAEAAGLQSVFKVLGNDTRLRILHALIRSGELRVTDMARTLKMTPQAVSNQLQRLAALGILSSRRDGTSIHYQIINPCIAPLLDLALCLNASKC